MRTCLFRLQSFSKRFLHVLVPAGFSFYSSIVLAEHTKLLSQQATQIVFHKRAVKSCQQLRNKNLKFFILCPQFLFFLFFTEKLASLDSSFAYSPFRISSKRSQSQGSMQGIGRACCPQFDILKHQSP